MFDMITTHIQKKVLLIQALIIMRVNNSSLTMKYRGDKFDKCRFMYNEVCSKIKEYSLSSDAILRLQRQYFCKYRTCISQKI